MDELLEPDIELQGLYVDIDIENDAEPGQRVDEPAPADTDTQALPLEERLALRAVADMLDVSDAKQASAIAVIRGLQYDTRVEQVRRLKQTSMTAFFESS
eukprot:SM000033S12415  [mRNA]  locus=s33:904600:904899:- [translate_table: standard]